MLPPPHQYSGMGTSAIAGCAQIFGQHWKLEKTGGLVFVLLPYWAVSSFKMFGRLPEQSCLLLTISIAMHMPECGEGILKELACQASGDLQSIYDQGSAIGKATEID